MDCSEDQSKIGLVQAAGTELCNQTSSCCSRTDGGEARGEGQVSLGKPSSCAANQNSNCGIVVVGSVPGCEVRPLVHVVPGSH